MKKILVTGTAGFIGHRTSLALLDAGWEVVGIDSINDYYSPQLKYDRLGNEGIGKDAAEYNRVVQSTLYPGYRFRRLRLEDRDAMAKFFEEEKFDSVCHLAAQAGVRYSIENPYAYGDSNLMGFLSILEGCRRAQIPHLIYASSSSVYGENASVPFKESDPVDNPVSFYAATKRANEVMSAAYCKLYGFSAVGLRFFTVYGPWGRPDMSPILFLKAMAEGKPIKVFNSGNMKRDFTYIDDIVGGLLAVLRGDHKAAGHNIYNIGRGSPMDLMEFIELLEKHSGFQAQKEYLPMQAGDVPITWADTSSLERDFTYKPSTDLDSGVKRFVQWYKEYYKIA